MTQSRSPQQGAFRMDAAERKALVGRAVALAIEAGDAAGARDLERHCAATSDAGCKAYAEGMIKVFERALGWARADRATATRREYEQVTDADRQQAVDELAVLHGNSRYASPHAIRTDETDHVAAVELRARSLARRRVAREDADALLLATPRRPSSAEPDPFDPLTNGVGPYASSAPGGKRGV